LAERIFPKLVYLPLDIFISVFFKKPFAAFVDDRFEFEITCGMELDVLGVTEDKPLG